MVGARIAIPGESVCCEQFVQIVAADEFQLVGAIIGFEAERGQVIRERLIDLLGQPQALG